jgi:hypothetical protein
MQSESKVLPDRELVPGGQDEHSPVPIVVLYVPTEHIEHAPPSIVLVYPILHVQFVTD